MGAVTEGQVISGVLALPCLDDHDMANVGPKALGHHAGVVPAGVVLVGDDHNVASAGEGLGVLSTPLPGTLGLHVATTPARTRASASFSPSTTKMVWPAATATRTSGKRYRTRGTWPRPQMKPPWPSGRR